MNTAILKTTLGAVALACSGAVGFRPVRCFFEDGIENQLLAIKRK